MNIFINNDRKGPKMNSIQHKFQVNGRGGIKSNSNQVQHIKSIQIKRKITIRENSDIPKLKCSGSRRDPCIIGNFSYHTSRIRIACQLARIQVKQQIIEIYLIKNDSTVTESHCQCSIPHKGAIEEVYIRITKDPQGSVDLKVRIGHE